MGTGRTSKRKEAPPDQLDMIKQGELGDGWSDPALVAIPQAEREKLARYTRDQIKARRPESYAEAVRLLAAGFGIVKVAGMLGFAVDSIRAIRDYETSLSTAKETLGRRLRAIGGIAVESIEEDFADPKRRAKISTKDKAIIAGIVIQRGEELLNGGPASTQPGPAWNLEELRAGLMGLRTAAREQKGMTMAEGVEVIDLAPVTTKAPATACDESQQKATGECESPDVMSADS